MNQGNKVSHNILIFIKKCGGSTTSDIANHFSLTSMAVRQHLHLHKINGLVSFVEQHAPRGRPKRVWYLTDKAQKTFPHDSDKLLIHLYTACKQSIKEPVDYMLKCYTEDLRLKLPHLNQSNKENIKSLCKSLTKLGYLNDVIFETSDIFRVKIYHCPHFSLVKKFEELHEFEQRLLPNLAESIFSVEMVSFHFIDLFHLEYILKSKVRV